MNELSLINNFIIEEFQKNDLVNSISIVPTIEIDMNKENIYPLVNIDLLTSSVEIGMVIASFEITVVQQRDVRPIKTDSKLLDNTNYIDNLNETHAIAQKFINFVNSQNNVLNIELESITPIDILKNWSRSSLDGVQFTIDLKIPNLGKTC